MKKILLSFIFFTFSLVAFGQGLDPTPANPAGVASAPIDGGILALVIGGAILGIRSWQERKNVKQE